jgi:hypothetical protein
MASVRERTIPFYISSLNIMEYQKNSLRVTRVLNGKLIQVNVRKQRSVVSGNRRFVTVLNTALA